MPTIDPEITATGMTRAVNHRLGDIGKADVHRVTSERVHVGPLAGAIRTRIELARWHNANDVDDMVRAIKFMPGYVDHTVQDGTTITFTFR